MREQLPDQSVVDAMKVIKDYCIKNDKCLNCPLATRPDEHSGNPCYIMNHYPKRWNVENIVEIQNYARY